MGKKEYDFEFLSCPIQEIGAEEVVAQLNQSMSLNSDKQKSAPYLMPHFPHSFFVDYFLKRYQDNKSDYENEPGKALAELEEAIGYCQTTDSLQKTLYFLYKKEFQHVHGHVIESFKNNFDPGKITIVHLSCKKYFDNAAASTNSFGNEFFNNLIIVGDENIQPGYTFDQDLNLLTVPAPDHYENLAEKMALLYRFLAFADFPSPLLKVDDDIRCLDPRKLARRATTLTATYDFVGRAIYHAQELGMPRWWHIGKNHEKTFDKRPWSLRSPFSYAAGGCGYGLSPKAVQILGKASIYLASEFASQGGLEDVAVGNILRYYEIYPYFFDFLSEKLLISLFD